MTRKELLDLLATHADELNRAERAVELDAEAWLSHQPTPAVQIASLLSLLQLAQAVKIALTPVQPSTRFRSVLRQRLSHIPEVTVRERPRRRHVWLGAAVLGSTLSLIGLVWLARYFKPNPSQSMTAV